MCLICIRLPRSSVLSSIFERSLDCLYLVDAIGSCIEASVGIIRPRCTTKSIATNVLFDCVSEFCVKQQQHQHFTCKLLL